MIPGEILPVAGWLEINADRVRVTIVVENAGDRPIQVGSHFHFADTNAALVFDRDAAQGCRMDIPAGTSKRFEPGMSAEVDLVGLAGTKLVPGLQIRRES